MNEEDYINEIYGTYGRRRPLISIAPVTKWLIIICVAVYLLLPEKFYPLLMFNSKNVASMPWILITNAFLHGSIFHLFFNMLSLFMFGSLIENRHGSKFVFLLFFLSVVLGNVSFGLLNPNIYGLGISGYIYALIGSAVILEPEARVIFPIGFMFTTAPVKIAGPIMFLGEVFYALGSTDGIGHIAHASGFLVGLVLAYIQRRRIISQWDRF